MPNVAQKAMDPVFNGPECLVTNRITVVNMSNKQTITALLDLFLLLPYVLFGKEVK